MHFNDWKCNIMICHCQVLTSLRLDWNLVRQSCVMSSLCLWGVIILKQIQSKSNTTIAWITTTQILTFLKLHLNRDNAFFASVKNYIVPRTIQHDYCLSLNITAKKDECNYMSALGSFWWFILKRLEDAAVTLTSGFF